MGDTDIRVLECVCYPRNVLQRKHYGQEHYLNAKFTRYSSTSPIFSFLFYFLTLINTIGTIS